MSGALLGLAFGLGVALIVTSRRHSDRLVRPASQPWWSRFVARREDLIRRSGGSAASVAVTYVAQAGAAALAAVAALVVTGSLVLAGWAGLAGLFVVPIQLRRRARRRATELRESWPDAVDSLAAAIRAGMSIPEAVEQLGAVGPEPLRAPVEMAMSSYHSSGRFDESLLVLREELADPVADRVVEVLRMARATGGSDLGRVLRTFSDLLREEARLRAEMEARAGWTINAARVAVAAPWLVLAMLATSSGVLEAYDSPGGALVLSVGAVVCLVAYRLMLRLGQVSGERRVMAP